jgi:ADP-heptose:LPS heptosyltransferase
MRILVVRIGRAGDIIMITPSLNAILDKYPDACVTVLTGPDGSRLLKNFHPRVEDIWIWNRSGLHDFFDKRKIRKKLAENPFDIIYCFDTSGSIAKTLNQSKAEFHRQITLDPDQHCAANYLDTVRENSDAPDKAYFAYLPVDTSAAEDVNNELLSHGIKPEDTMIMLHPSYSGYTPNPIKTMLRKNNRSLIHRFWPTENFGKLADLLSRYEINNGKTPKVIVDLMPEETPLGKIIQANSDNAIVLQVKPNFERYKALIKRADLLVTPNTGPMHIAAAVGTKVVALFSDWNPVDCGPYMESSLFKIIQAENMPNPKKGLAAIQPETVLDACKKLLH